MGDTQAFIATQINSGPQDVQGMKSLSPIQLTNLNGKCFFIEVGADLTGELPPAFEVGGNGGGLQSSPTAPFRNLAPTYHVDLSHINHYTNAIDKSKFSVTWKVALDSCLILKNKSLAPIGQTINPSPPPATLPAPAFLNPNSDLHLNDEAIYLCSDQLQSQCGNPRYFLRFQASNGLNLINNLQTVAFARYEPFQALPDRLSFQFPCWLDNLPDDVTRYYANSPRVATLRDMTTGRPFASPYYDNQYVQKWNVRFIIQCDVTINNLPIYGHLAPLEHDAPVDNSGGQPPQPPDNRGGGGGGVGGGSGSNHARDFGHLMNAVYNMAQTPEQREGPSSVRRAMNLIGQGADFASAHAGTIYAAANAAAAGVGALRAGAGLRAAAAAARAGADVQPTPLGWDGFVNGMTSGGGQPVGGGGGSRVPIPPASLGVEVEMDNILNADGAPIPFIDPAEGGDSVVAEETTPRPPSYNHASPTNGRAEIANEVRLAHRFARHAIPGLLNTETGRYEWDIYRQYLEDEMGMSPEHATETVERFAHQLGGPDVIAPDSDFVDTLLEGMAGHMPGGQFSSVHADFFRNLQESHQTGRVSDQIIRDLERHDQRENELPIVGGALAAAIGDISRIANAGITAQLPERYRTLTPANLAIHTAIHRALGVGGSERGGRSITSASISHTAAQDAVVVVPSGVAASVNPVVQAPPLTLAAATPSGESVAPVSVVVAPDPSLHNHTSPTNSEIGRTIRARGGGAPKRGRENTLEEAAAAPPAAKRPRRAVVARGNVHQLAAGSSAASSTGDAPAVVPAVVPSFVFGKAGTAPSALFKMSGKK